MAQDKYLKVVLGDLLEADETYLFHQCNCVSTKPWGLAKTMFDRYPEANTYNQDDRNPGFVEFVEVDHGRKIINAYCQYYPGKPRYETDTSALRLSWFLKCLKTVRSAGIRSLAMPYNIGCGLAGGDWDQYFLAITNFARRYQIYITLYKLCNI